MQKGVFIIAMTLTIFFNSCADSAIEEEQKATSNNIELAVAQSAWIEERVTKAENRLLQTDAGKIVWQGMNAHGGLKKWYSNGPISFHFNYKPLSNKPGRNTYVVMDTWSARARHKHPVDTTMQFGWNGQQVWTNTKDSTAFPFDIRFWALTPYYFSALPFVLDGEGVNLEQLNQKEFKGNMYDVVKVTFDEGTGDAPDDYYILYFHAVNHKLAVIRYIVSYPEYFEEKGQHSPEKFMELTGSQTVDGITLPIGYKTYMLADNEEPGEHVTNIELTEVSFLPKLPSAYFDTPEGAFVQ